MTMAAQQTTTLSTALREGTRPEHERAEGTDFIGALMGGRLPLGAYTALAVQQHAIYRALETEVAAARAADPSLLVLFDPALTRTAAIEADLDFLTQQAWRSPDGAVELTALPATGRYVQAIHDAGPTRLLAHHYVRYLGDLSGGQVVRRRLQDTYGLNDAGLAFYTFTSIEKVKPYKDRYRQALDDLDLSAAERAAVVAEAQSAFRHNSAVFTQLGEHWLSRHALTPAL